MAEQKKKHAKVCLGPFERYYLKVKGDRKPKIILVLITPKNSLVPNVNVQLKVHRLVALLKEKPDSGSQQSNLYAVYKAENPEIYFPYLAPIPKQYTRIAELTAIGCGKCGYLRVSLLGDGVNVYCRMCGVTPKINRVVWRDTGEPIDDAIQGKGILTFEPTLDWVPQYVVISKRKERLYNNVKLEVVDYLSAKYIFAQNKVVSGLFRDISAFNNTVTLFVRELKDDEERLKLLENVLTKETSAILSKWKIIAALLTEMSDKKLAREMISKYNLYIYLKEENIDIAMLNNEEDTKESLVKA